MISIVTWLIILTMSGSALTDTDGGGLLLRFYSQREWRSPRRPVVPRYILRYMLENSYEGNTEDQEYHKVEKAQKRKPGKIEMLILWLLF